MLTIRCFIPPNRRVEHFFAGQRRLFLRILQTIVLTGYDQTRLDDGTRLLYRCFLHNHRLERVIARGNADRRCNEKSWEVATDGRH